MTTRNKIIAAIFVGPIVAAVDQLGSYFLVYFARHRATNLVFALTTFVAAAIIAAAFAVSFIELKRTDPEKGVDRFLAGLGVTMNVFFLAVVVVGYGLPSLVLHPTD